MLVKFLSIFLLGLVSGVSLSHFLQRGPKKTLPPAQFLAIQQVLLRNYGLAMGGLEVAALFSTLEMAIVTRGEPVVRILATLLRPVTVRDKRNAARTASDPVLQNVMRSLPVISQNILATSPASGVCGPVSNPS